MPAPAAGAASQGAALPNAASTRLPLLPPRAPRAQQQYFQGFVQHVGLNTAGRSSRSPGVCARSSTQGQPPDPPWRSGAVGSSDFGNDSRNAGSSWSGAGNAHSEEWDTDDPQTAWDPQQDTSSAVWNTGVDPFDTGASESDATPGQQTDSPGEWDTGEEQWEVTSGGNMGGRGRGGGFTQADVGKDMYEPGSEHTRQGGIDDASSSVDNNPVAATAEEELEDARKPFHRRLAEAAAAGDVSAVEVVLQDLEAAGMQPGPRAFHVLVFTHTKLEQHEEAWHAATRAIAAGAVLLEETYILFILGHMKDAAAVAMRAYRQEASRESGGGPGPPFEHDEPPGWQPSRRSQGVARTDSGAHSWWLH